MTDLTGKRALVTGAGRGIGREIALELARAGASVVIINRNPERGSAVLTEIKEANGEGWSLLGLSLIHISEPTRPY